jgi:hypothetical protein
MPREPLPGGSATPEPSPRHLPDTRDCQRFMGGVAVCRVGPDGVNLRPARACLIGLPNDDLSDRFWPHEPVALLRD